MATTEASKNHDITLLDVLRELDAEALRAFFDDYYCSDFRGARRTCRALRDLVDSNIHHAYFHLAKRMLAPWRPGQASPLARFQRVSTLTLRIPDPADPSEVEEEPAWVQPPPATEPAPHLLAALCFSGVGLEVTSRIRHLRLVCEVAGDVPAMLGCAAALGGRLGGVTRLTLIANPDTDLYFKNPIGLWTEYAALSASLPALTHVELPYLSCLQGIHAFAHSRLTHISTCCGGNGGLLRLSQVRSLCQLPQLQGLEVSGRLLEDPYGYDGAMRQGLAQAAAAAAAGVPGDDEADTATCAEVGPPAVEQLWALRHLLTRAPAALEQSFTLHGFALHNYNERPRQQLGDNRNEDEEEEEEEEEHGMQEYANVEDLCVCLEAGRLVRVTVDACNARGLNYLAAALLPKLLTTAGLPPHRRRHQPHQLPLLALQRVDLPSPARMRRYLQPQQPLPRLLALCDRVEVGELGLGLGGAFTRTSPCPAADLTAAVRAVLPLTGWPHSLMVWNKCDVWLQLQLAPDKQEEGKMGGDTAAAATTTATAAATSAATAAAEVASPVPCLSKESTGDDVLRRAVGAMWAAAQSPAAAAATVEAAMAAQPTTCVDSDGEEVREKPPSSRLFVLLRGPLIAQQLMPPGHSGTGSGVGEGLVGSDGVGGVGGGGGAGDDQPLLQQWLRSLLKRRGRQAVAEAAEAEENDNEESVEAAPKKGALARLMAARPRFCSLVVVPAAAFVAVHCERPRVMLRLLRAAVAAAARTPAGGCGLQVAALSRVGYDSYGMCCHLDWALDKAVQQVGRAAR